MVTEHTSFKNGITLMKAKGDFRKTRMITTHKKWPDALLSRLTASLVLLLSVCFANTSNAQDVLLIKKANSDTIQKRKGIIEDWLGYSITISVNGSSKEIDSTQVVDLQTTWPAAYESGKRLAADGKTSEAIQKYREALTVEKRPWAQRIIRSKLIPAYQLVGNSSAAVNEFQTIIAQDHNTRFMHLIPLPWSNRVRPVPGAGGWLDSDQTALQLLGAGWSLTTEKNQQKRAAETLDQLAGDLDPRIRNLATAQLWRLRTRLSPKQIKQWERIVAGMESENRAGAMLILANAQQKHGNLDAALLNWMKIVTLHEHQSMLVAASLFQTASALRSITPDQTKQKSYPQPDSFFAELNQRFPESSWAQQAMFDTGKN